jgi:hypothetical protein
MQVRAPTADERYETKGDLWTCVVCSEAYPVSQMRFQDGIEGDQRCPNDYAANGGELARDLMRAAASELAAQMTERYAAPSRFGIWLDDRTLTALIDFSARPVVLHRGGAAVALTIAGSNLAADDVIVYGHAGITDSVAPSLTPVTYGSDGNALTPFVDVLVLTVAASVAVPIGLYSMTYDDTEYRNCFDVRG